ncbi:MAG: sarcosine oxidase subunit delta [Gemmatimonadaceae bacterium]
MTLKVTCPYCGPRYTTEFWFGGEVIPHHTTDAASATAHDDDFARVWLKSNVAGLQDERWFHHAGCRRWFTAHRDTRNNAFQPSDGAGHS